MHALFYIALVLLLIYLFGPGMAVLLDPWVALLVALLLVAFVAQLDSSNESAAE
jgi:uncharacterized membrane protein YtjA (UPF0391 family)